MPLKIVRLQEDHLEAASRLLADSHLRARPIEPLLPAMFESAEVAAGPLSEALRSEHASGVAALRDGLLVGYLLGVGRMPMRMLSMPYHGHALAAGEGNDLYREMYAVLADDWLSRGFFSHAVGNVAVDEAAQRTWDGLGFGSGLVLAVRDTEASVPDAPEVDVRKVGPESLDVVLSLEEAQRRHHNAAPIYNLYLPEERAHSRARFEELLQDPGSGHFVAFEDGAPVGMVTFMAKSWVPAMLQPDDSIYLFQGIVFPERRRGGVGRGLLAYALRWAREQGYRWCTLHYFSTNIPGASFWQSNHFRPLELARFRQIDDRIAWARWQNFT